MIWLGFLDLLLFGEISFHFQAVNVASPRTKHQSEFTFRSVTIALRPLQYLLQPWGPKFIEQNIFISLITRRPTYHQKDPFNWFTNKKIILEAVVNFTEYGGVKSYPDPVENSGAD